MAHRAAATALLSPPPITLPTLPKVPIETQLPSGPRWFNIDVVFCNTNLLVSIGIGLVAVVVGGSREEDEELLHTSSMAATRPHISRLLLGRAFDDDIANIGGEANVDPLGSSRLRT